MSLFARLFAPAMSGFFVAAAVAQNLTVQVGAPPLPPTPLVEHTNIWRWHKGTNAPVAGWQTISDASLDATWGSGPGGFGYSDDTANETNQCRTILSDMKGTSATNYSTFYIRQTFTIDGSVDTNRHIRLTMDWDDGFIAWLDGVYITNSLVTGAPAEPPFTATSSANHESSRGTSTPVNPPTTYDLGAVGTRTGTHVLAIIGLNGNKSTSSDFILIPDLSIAAPTNSGAVPNNGLYALTPNGSVTLTGTNTILGSSRVTINGDDSVFFPAQGLWTNTVTLTPGFNRLFIAALDASGNMLSNRTQDIVYEPTSVNVSGPLGANTFWTNTSEVIHVTGTVAVPSGITLTIGPGVVVIVSPGASILATAGGTIDVQGADTREVYFLPATSGVWNEIAADGANSFLTIRYADINRGAVKFRNGATGLLEDSYVHEYKNGSTPIAGCTSAAGVTVRRSHFSVYHETLWQNTPMTVEHCVFENADNASSDALDFDGAPPGSVIRRTTFRFGPQSNTDAIDIGPFGNEGSTNTVIEGCIMHDFPNDKGVSIGEGSYGIVVRNCLIHHTESGIGVKNSPATPTNKPPCTAIVYNCTITDNEFGFRCYHKQDANSPTDGGRITNSYNNILWNNLLNIGVYNGGEVIANYSDIGGTNWPGTGNIDADPLFVNPATRDYRVQAGSPTLGSGVDGTNMGIVLPVGGIPMWVSNLVAVAAGTNDLALSWRETADNEDGFIIERSTDKLAWQIAGQTAAGVTNFADATGLAGQKYYYRVRATNDLGVSPYSNLASGERQAPIIYVGGTISASTVWGPGVTVIVTSSVTVAVGATLTIQPCTQVLFNQGFSMTVNGLLIAEGTPDCRIVFTRNVAAGATSWNNINMLGAAGTHRLRYVDIDYSTGNLDANGATLFLQNIWWTNTTAQLLNMVGTSVTFLDSYVPGGFGNEPIHFSSMPTNGFALIKNNVFGAPSGYNDSVDFTGGNRPGPIVQFIDNVFLAAVDDCMDLDSTDAHIEGNIFMNVHQDAVRASTANAVSTGEGSGTSELVVVRNIFYNCDHAMLLKDMGSAVFENNTVVTIETNQFSRTVAAYVQFGEPHRGVPGGRGIVMNGNILWDLHSDTPFIVFTNGTMFMTANDNIIQGTNMMFGGNSTNDPMFVNWQTGITYLNIKSNLALLAGSPAIGTGPNGLDRGALVPSGASISGEPVGTTANTSATLKVAGPGIYAYRWKLNNGPWSAEVPLTNNILITATLFSNAVPITLNGLSNGTYTVSVIGKNSAGFWQDTNSPTISKTWTVAIPPDSDGDGMPDDWETMHGLLVGVNDADADADNDGMTNLAEYLAGTDPQSPASRLWLQSLPATGSIAFSFEAVAGKGYTVQSRTSLSTGVWLHLADFEAVPSNRTVHVTNTLVDPARFYRVTTPIVP